MFQGIVVALIFIAAVVYAIRLAYKSFFTKSECASGCGKCGVVDFNKIEQQLKQKGL